MIMCLQSIAAGLSLATLTALVAGCGRAADIRHGDIRSYTLPRRQAAALSDAAGRSSGGDGGLPRLSYEVPEGWRDRGGGGIRLATLTIGEPAASHDVTVIPASGTLEGNVARWQGQLEPGQEPGAAAEAVAAAIAGAEVVEAAGLVATVILLLDEVALTAADQPADSLSDPDGEAILAAMLPLPGEPAGGAALFVKFKGPSAIARREKGRFMGFVKSLRLDPPDATASPRPAGHGDEGRSHAGRPDEE
jgi:hypothetical protein